MAVSEHTEPRRYGNYRKPRSPGLGPLGLAGTVLVFVGLLGVLFSLILGQIILGVIWFVMVLVTIAVITVRDHHNRTLAQRAANRLAWSKTKRSREHLYRSGPIGRARTGTFQLPGVLAATTLHEFADSYGRPFGLLETKAVGHYSVVIACAPDGASLVDQGQIDQWVAAWGQWLAHLTQEPGLVAAAVTVETAPDTGTRLRRQIQSRMDETAPQIAVDMLNEITQEYPVGSARVRAWVSLTFEAKTAGGRRRSAEDVGRDVATRLPGLTQGLASTGAGPAAPVDALGICEIVRVAYDPAAAVLLDEIHAQGAAPDLTWADAGPTATESSWDSYRHDSAVSRSWLMTSAPRGEVHERILSSLLAPHPDIDRKRVTIIYRPLPPARAVAAVEGDLRAADFRLSSSSRPSARALQDKRAAQATAHEESTGAALVDFGLIVTATVTDPARLVDAASAVDNLTASARLVIRPAFGAQDSAFAAGLPLGIVLQSHMRVPNEIRGAM